MALDPGKWKASVEDRTIAPGTSPSRPGGPTAKRQPSPEGLGWSPHHHLSAVGAAPMLSSTNWLH